MGWVHLLCMYDDVGHAHHGGRTGVAFTIDPAHVAEVRDNLGASHPSPSSES